MKIVFELEQEDKKGWKGTGKYDWYFTPRDFGDDYILVGGTLYGFTDEGSSDEVRSFWIETEGQVGIGPKDNNVEGISLGSGFKTENPKRVKIKGLILEEVK